MTAQSGADPTRLYMDPRDLLKINPPALVVNQPVYAHIKQTGFLFDLFDPPNIARVQMDDGEVMWLIIDGHTRVLYAAEHADQPLPKEAPYLLNRIPVRDTTSTYRSAAADRDYLSPAEYLHAVSMNTVGQGQILPRRLAAYVLRAWDGLVGPHLAEQVPALVALRLVGQTNWQSMPDLLPEVPAAQRQQLERAVGTIKEALDQARKDYPDLRPQHILDEALLLLATKHESVGGRSQAIREVSGLLRVPALERKLADDLPTTAQREALRVRLAKEFLAAVQRAVEHKHRPGAPPNYEDLLKTLINDTLLRAHDISTVLCHPQPTVTYQALRAQRLRERVTAEYTALRDTDATALSDLERALLDGYAHSLRPPGSEPAAQSLDLIRSTVNAVASAEKVATEGRGDAAFAPPEGQRALALLDAAVADAHKAAQEVSRAGRKVPDFFSRVRDARDMVRQRMARVQTYQHHRRAYEQCTALLAHAAGHDARAAGWAGVAGVSWYICSAQETERGAPFDPARAQRLFAELLALPDDLLRRVISTTDPLLLGQAQHEVTRRARDAAAAQEPPQKAQHPAPRMVVGAPQHTQPTPPAAAAQTAQDNARARALMTALLAQWPTGLVPATCEDMTKAAGEQLLDVVGRALYGHNLAFVLHEYERDQRQRQQELLDQQRTIIEDSL